MLKLHIFNKAFAIAAFCCCHIGNQWGAQTLTIKILSFF